MTYPKNKPIYDNPAPPYEEDNGLPPFEPVPFCCKCGSSTIERRYICNAGYDDGSLDERLSNICDVCGYKWHSKTKDAK